MHLALLYPMVNLPSDYYIKSLFIPGNFLALQFIVSGIN